MPEICSIAFPICQRLFILELHIKQIQYASGIFAYLCFIAACAAASLAIGTLNGEQDT